MPPPKTSNRRAFLLILFSVTISILFVTTFRSQGFSGTPQIAKFEASTSSHSQASLSGHAIAPRLYNETIKAELGRAAWKLFHTMMARFPDSPTMDEQEALRSYIYLFQRLYPCGECAEHFGEVLLKFPPQVSSRNAVAGWACHVHNEVNKSLQKPIFDCSNIGDFYDCGCGEDEKEGMNAVGSETTGWTTGPNARRQEDKHLDGWRDMRAHRG